MCGIVGALSFNHFKITADYINKMRDEMIHRGPDGAGTWINASGNLGLGHRRLSIIDLSDNATQPMSNPANTLWLTFNGEIYNHTELRQQLIALGHTQWKTDHSDSEVLLRAFEQWGISCVERLRGMFAFAIWDARENCLWLARDHVGIKPLYFSMHHQRLVFASEIKALLQDRQQPREVNDEALYHYLTFLTTPAPSTLFKGIYKLQPGSWMRINHRGETKTERYWDVLERAKPLQTQDEDEIAASILAQLQESVRLRKTSDVPVGVFLSGGIDSSTNTALFAKDSVHPVKTFSIGYHGNYKRYTNELEYARRMAREVHADYHEKLLSQEDLLNFLPQMIKLQDEPIADPVCVPVYYVSKLAKDNGVTVCQVGEGADELFWGYRSWKALLKLQQLSNVPATGWLQKLGCQLFNVLGKNQGMEYECLRRGANRLPIFWGGAQAFTYMQKKQLLTAELQHSLNGLTSWDAISPLWQHFKDNAWQPSALNWMSYCDLNFRLPELLLMRVDKMSMGVSLEGRVPFLDKQFVTHAMSIPSQLKTKHGILKYLLKKSVRGVIPDELIDRKKQGFSVPIYEWFFDKLGEHTRCELNQFCQQTNYFNKTYIDTLMAQKKGPQVWYLLNFALWWKEYIA